MSDIFKGLFETAEFGEEHFVAQVQAKLAEMLDDKGVSRAELARKLGVSRARVTQIFSDDAKNFTLRLLARSYLALGETPVVLSRTEYEGLLASAASDSDKRRPAQPRNEDSVLSAALIADLLRASEARGEPERLSRRADSADEWAKVGLNVVPLRKAANG